ncbi:hypothetical protein BJX63DRAFT_360828 [Aspergillus granulosus]|uniref:Kinesin light chain n=1 Tax=Aspergillus granulosus TaxID=176169 RepID=A0ABR4HYJ0_9EURO
MVIEHPTNHLSTQLALCYKLGFGQAKGDEQLKILTYNRDEIRVQLKNAISSEQAEYAGTLYNRLAIMGHHSPLFLAGYYHAHDILEIAESITKKDIENLGHVLQVEHPIILFLKYVLSSILSYRGRWPEAEKLEVEIMDISRMTLGQEHPDTLTSMGNLAATYRDQGRWEEAEKLETKVMDTRQRTLGHDIQILWP